MAFWITSHMRTKRKQVDDKLVVIKLFAVIMQEIFSTKRSRESVFKEGAMIGGENSFGEV
jgi:hypothetical protein